MQVSAKIATDGVLYVLGDHTVSKTWKYASGTWTDITPFGWAGMTMTTDPFNPARIAVFTGGTMVQSLDRGANWQYIWGNFTLGYSDIPWMSSINYGWMTMGDTYFDPVTPNLIHMVDGLGYWSATVTSTHNSGTPVPWVEKSIGIEELVANHVLSPPGGTPLAMVWDKGVFRLTNPDVYPSSHGPGGTTPVLHGFYASYAKNNPSFIVGIFHSTVAGNHEESSYSSDGGVTWTQFATKPPYITTGSYSGVLEASTTTNYVWAPIGEGDPYYTLDGGANWVKATFPGAPTSAPKGFGDYGSFGTHLLAVDHVTANKFYLYNTQLGLYTTTNGGANWSLTYSGLLGSECNNSRLHSVPGNAGHLFFTPGLCDGVGVSHPLNRNLVHSTDGGVTWSTIANVKEARYIGFGKAAPFATYPTMYMVGWVNNVFGVYRSTDEGQTWTKFGEYPVSLLDTIQGIDGDMNTYGRVYVSFSGSGFAYFGE